MGVCVCECVCVRACVRARVCVCVSVCMWGVFLKMNVVLRGGVYMSALRCMTRGVKNSVTYFTDAPNMQPPSRSMISGGSAITVYQYCYFDFGRVLWIRRVDREDG